MIVVNTGSFEYDSLALRQIINTEFANEYQVVYVETISPELIENIIAESESVSLIAGKCVYVFQSVDISDLGEYLSCIVTLPNVILSSVKGKDYKIKLNNKSIRWVIEGTNEKTEHSSVQAKLAKLLPGLSTNEYSILIQRVTTTNEQGNFIISPKGVEILIREIESLTKTTQLSGSEIANLFTSDSIEADHWNILRYLFYEPLNRSREYFLTLFRNRGFYETLGEIRNSALLLFTLFSTNSSPELISKSIKRHPYFISRLMSESRDYRVTKNGLYRLLECIINVDLNIKQGLLDDENTIWDIEFSKFRLNP